MTEAARPDRSSGPAPRPTVKGYWSLALLRIGIGLLWIQNANWKFPPFAGLRGYTGAAVEHPVFPPFSWLVEHVILVNFTPFAYGVMLLEMALGGFLLVGLATRWWALLGIAQTVAIALSVLNVPHEWHWSYLLMLLAHIVILGTAAGRYAGLDGVLRPSWQSSSSRFARVLVRAS
ncbi:MAG: TQO small subunit DoxD [Microlunatus sp.]|nr:TQO small subunit DoxD [Microlunatus sp.]MDN5803638.1 TQO small subunit DoxD [Microlunatus sp.]